MSYEFFPQVYDQLMDEELYDEWLSFTLSLIKQEGGKVLDLACGTGEFLLRMKLAGFDASGVDLSSEMLNVAAKKFAQIEMEVPLYEQNMTTLNLPYQVDLVTCFCDSLNYLETEKDLDETLAAVYKTLSFQGIFLFDVHSIYKMDVGFKDYSYGDSDEFVATIWNSFKGEFPHSVNHELTFFVEMEDGNYFRRDELHKERTYPVGVYIEKLSQAGFDKVEVFADFKKRKPDETSERIFFVAYKHFSR
ncbi:class I SAM-dependent methyltransferase [Listeria sp. PSOL-1]|uniref:class I SAM-dependent DNA methyltransferase n=1 Tax=Listeria sp. PSOL-1 TaxID=1844999 RepID=UPI0013D6EB2D|nr:class I SAM-dependent methyltransferase [Listeria sp. PSOL-1]